MQAVPTDPARGPEPWEVLDSVGPGWALHIGTAIYIRLRKFKCKISKVGRLKKATI